MNPLAPLFRSTYSTDVNRLLKFTQKYKNIRFRRQNFGQPSHLSLSLLFLAAYLFEIYSIRAYNTIRNYMSHASTIDNQFYELVYKVNNTVLL